MGRSNGARAGRIRLGAMAAALLFGKTAAAQPAEAPQAAPAAPPSTAAPAPAPAPPPAASAPAAAATLPPPVAAPAPPAPSAQPPAPANAEKAEPFSTYDFTWLNGGNRQQKALLDSEIFTGSYLLDINYTASLNNPIDNTVVGSTVISRNNEVTLQFMGFGGDFHYKNARARLMTQFGVRSTQIPRNDFSAFHGQFDLDNALRYISEANGGYHWDVLDGVNIDAGIFMSYVGLFSFNNFENWMYMPSYTSDNTPWFFNGIRVQVFTSDKFKVEPWVINGWQTYGKFNEKPGFGFQALWRPVEWFSFVENAYVGWDTQDEPGRMRFHSDNSLQFLFYKNPDGFLTKMATSITWDLGGENGDGVVPFSGKHSDDLIKNPCTVASPCEQDFLSAMTYVRAWFGEEWAVTVGGGMMNNPGRYLILTPTGNASPIPQPQSLQGISYVPATNPYNNAQGSEFFAWDYSFGFQYMPIEQFTLDVEWNHRAASVPFFAGHGGVTSPDGYITTGTPGGWRPDLVKTDDRLIAAWLVRF